MRRIFVAITALSLGWSNVASAQHPASAQGILESSVAAMGGRARLTRIHSLRMVANAQRNLLEQSARPEWPWITDYYRLDLTLAFSAQRLRALEQRNGRLGWLENPTTEPQSTEYWVAHGMAVTRVAGDLRPYSQAAVQDASDLNALNPIALLLTASSSSVLHLDKEVEFQGTMHHVVKFSWQGYPAKVLVNKDTFLPSAVSWLSTRPRDLFWSTWGDITTQMRFANWNLRPEGIRFPTQWVVERNDLPDRIFEVTSLVLNPEATHPEWTIPEALARQVQNMTLRIADLPLGLADAPPVEIAPGIIRIPGRWDVTIVQQQDGLVIVEAPISSAYSERVLEEAGRRFPGIPVKAVITTSDAWPHIAGLRTYVNRGIPLYVLDLNLPIVGRVLSARFSLEPDALERRPRAPRIHRVATVDSLGDGPNRILLRPLRAAVGERQMLVEFPAHKLVYTSDVVQQGMDGGWYAPEMLLELSEVFERDSMTPLKCFGMHYGLTDWRAMKDALDRHLSRDENNKQAIDFRHTP